MYYTRHLCTD